MISEDRLKTFEKRQRFILVGMILDHLNRVEVRATYKAVAGVIGESNQNVKNYLPPRGPRASWVVSSDGDNSPTGYTREQEHPRLRLKPRIISTTDDLRNELGWDGLPKFPRAGD